MKIYIYEKTTPETEAEIQELINHTVLYNPGMSGESIVIERGEYVDLTYPYIDAPGREYDPDVLSLYNSVMDITQKAERLATGEDR